MAEKKNNTKKIKEEKVRSEEQQEIIRFIKILLIVLLIVCVVYVATRIFVKQDLGKEVKETSVTEVSYSKMVFGTMLNRNEDSYYVLAFSSEDNKANYYSALAASYMSDKESLYVYYIDLKDALNKDYIAIDGKSNKDAKRVSELKVGELTLIKVEKGKIVKYLESLDEIKSEFKID